MVKGKIEITERDVLMLKNVPKLFNRAKFELGGNEVLPCAQTLEYLGGLIALFEKNLQPKENSLKVSGSPEKGEPVVSEKKMVKRGRPKKKKEEVK